VRALAVALALGYPLLAHAASHWRSASLALAAGAVLVVLVALPGISRGQRVGWLVLGIGVALLAALAALGNAQLPLFLPPVAINAFLAWLFGHTLLRGRMPLIERLVRLLHPPAEPLDTRVPGYARRLTALWALLFAALALAAAVLALLAVPGGLLDAAGITPPLAVPLATWSLWTNLLAYLAVGALFMGEYAWRRRVFPQQPYRGFAGFTRQVAAAGPRLWRAMRAAD
jgi:uncharacterized membrane protein